MTTLRSLHSGFVFERCSATVHPRVNIWPQTPRMWRIVVTDDLGDSDVTGPPYPTKREAVEAVPEAAAGWL